MAVGVEVDVSQQGVIRQYRGTTAADVERDYTADAAKAASRGYLPLRHQWGSDPNGLVLSVTYAQSVPAAAPPPPPGLTQRATAAGEEHRELGASFEPYRARPADAYTRFAPPEIAVSDIDAPLAAEQETAEAHAELAVGAVDSHVAEDELEVAEAESQPADDESTFPQPTFDDETFDRLDGDDRSLPTFEDAAEHPEWPAADLGRSASVAPDAPGVDATERGAARDLAASSAFEVRAALDSAASEPEDTAPTGDGFAEPSLEQDSPAQRAHPLEENSAPALVGQEREQTEPQIATSVESAPPSSAQPTVTGRHAALTVQTMDMHTAGEPLRIIRSGFPDVPNLTVLERRQWVMAHADHVRRALVNEPRGHRDMYGAILLPPHTGDADICVLFMHNEGYSTMCGHGIIAITAGLIEEGLYPAESPITTIRYEVPAGIVAANAASTQLPDGSWAVHGVRFTNVPSYVAAQSLAVRPDGVELHGTAAQYGALSVDLAFGGAYYGIVNAADLGLRVVPDQASHLRAAGAAITDVLRRDHTPAHPTDADLSFVYGTIIVDLDPRTSPDGRARDAHMRNATIFADAELDRSPCGSGTSAILAQLHARGRIKVGQQIINAGITGEHFLGRVEAETSLGPYPAITTSIAGTAFVTGYSTFVVDDRDPLGEGFVLS